MSTMSRTWATSQKQSKLGAASTMTKRSPSPVKLTAEKMQMLRRDVKPGNGTSLLTY